MHEYLTFASVWEACRICWAVVAAACTFACSGMVPSCLFIVSVTQHISPFTNHVKSTLTCVTHISGCASSQLGVCAEMVLVLWNFKDGILIILGSGYISEPHGNSY